ncbi:Protein of unknown function (DUF674 [Striga hermonthica]|uniref:DUF674 family protein n=1 Tax=Striga hermonthica TaxID=68872 RepID=A0A9N7R2S9_STRHE|nr:Protein of unknown function (DUF674 [Striga hermonthica]
MLNQDTTMAATKDVQFTLKVMINKDKTKVLFAEADSDFTNVLLSFLALPLGKIAKILVEHYGDDTLAICSFTSLYNSLADLDVVHFHTESGKQMLLNPRSVFDKECRQLKLNLSDSELTKYFTCGKSSSGEHNFSMNYDTVICDCGKTMTRETELRSSETIEDGAEMRSVTFGYNEIIDFLKGMLVSKTPLTDIILGRTQNNSEEVQKIKSSGVFLPKTDEAAASNSEKMMTLKVVIQRSTRVFLFAQANGDFADFLFSLLTIPLGVALSLLGSSTGNGNYVKGPKMFMMTDDLTVTPLCLTSSLSTLDRLGIPLSDVEELELKVGLEEALSILEASLTSTSALTNGLLRPSLRKCVNTEANVWRFLH